MIDAVVSFVVGRLEDFIIQEAVFLGGVKNEVELLKNELEWMQCFIKDAEEKQSNDPMIRQWVSGIIDLAYDAEDVLDAFSLEVQHGRISDTVDVDEGVTLKRRLRFFSSVMNCSCALKMVNLYSIGNEIEKLRMRISDLSRKREAYKLQDSRSMSEGNSKALSKLKDLRRQNSITVEENVVGFHADADQLLPKLLGDEPGRIVISIFGMGGLGKTTLAKKFYHNNDINKHFDHCAWVSISEDFDNRDVLQRIIESFKMIKTRKEMQEIGKLSKENLERKLHKFLQEQRYLLVLDDVWKESFTSFCKNNDIYWCWMMYGKRKLGRA